MNTAIAVPNSPAAARRDRLAGLYQRAEHAVMLAVLDHVGEYVQAVCPQARYIEFAFRSETRSVDLGGVYGGQPSPLGVCPLLWEATTDDDHPLSAVKDDLLRDVEMVLAPSSSPAWSSVQPNSASDSNSWLLELPPADRVARIAELVRQHHPDAAALIIDCRTTGGRVIQIIDGPKGKESREHASWRWSGRTDIEISRLLRQLLLLPDLRDRHFEQVPDGFRHPFGDDCNDSAYVLKLPANGPVTRTAR